MCCPQEMRTKDSGNLVQMPLKGYARSGAVGAQAVFCFLGTNCWLSAFMKGNSAGKPIHPGMGHSVPAVAGGQCICVLAEGRWTLCN